MSSLINESGFRRESAKLRISASQSDKFYKGVVELLLEFYKKDPNWKTIMAIEENKLWPVLQTLNTPTHSIFDGVGEVVRNEFLNSIMDESRIRSEKTISRDSRDYLIFLLKKRIPFLQDIIEVTPDDIRDFKSGSSWIKWILFGVGAVAVMGIISRGKSTPKKDEKK